ncbi:hypothetical protein B0H66DRAFT_625639 [Apodospora peruviana]|uniref:Uncharacterized protein n=1 Tax=Apodospora peruviana TaxID=516989 RepID=A0AAE0M284_9PEZI|nr:hypothetical protein B0H66DRAFT_625639 [Apodospora peruviana]
MLTTHPASLIIVGLSFAIVIPSMRWKNPSNDLRNSTITYFQLFPSLSSYYRNCTKIVNRHHDHWHQHHTAAIATSLRKKPTTTEGAAPSLFKPDSDPRVLPVVIHNLTDIESAKGFPSSPSLEVSSPGKYPTALPCLDDETTQCVRPSLSAASGAARPPASWRIPAPAPTNGAPSAPDTSGGCPSPTRGATAPFHVKTSEHMIPIVPLDIWIRQSRACRAHGSVVDNPEATRLRRACDMCSQRKVKSQVGEEAHETPYCSSIGTEYRISLLAQCGLQSV